VKATSGATTEPPAIFDQARELSKAHAQEQRRAAAAKEKSATSKECDFDEFAELEQTLLRGSTVSSPSTSSEATGTETVARPPKSGLALSPSECPFSASVMSSGSSNGPTAAHEPAAAVAKAEARASTTAKDSSLPKSDIDDLFNEFDAVLESVDGDIGSSAGKTSPDQATSTPSKQAEAKIVAATPSAATKFAPPPRDPKPLESAAVADVAKAADKDDMFGDVDAFLAELDAK